MFACRASLSVALAYVIILCGTFSWMFPQDSEDLPPGFLQNVPTVILYPSFLQNVSGLMLPDKISVGTPAVDLTISNHKFCRSQDNQLEYVAVISLPSDKDRIGSATLSCDTALKASASGIKSTVTPHPSVILVARFKVSWAPWLLRLSIIDVAGDGSNEASSLELQTKAIDPLWTLDTSDIILGHADQGSHRAIAVYFHDDRVTLFLVSPTLDKASWPTHAPSFAHEPTTLETANNWWMRAPDLGVNDILRDLVSRSITLDDANGHLAVQEFMIEDHDAGKYSIKGKLGPQMKGWGTTLDFSGKDLKLVTIETQIADETCNFQTDQDRDRCKKRNQYRHDRASRLSASLTQLAVGVSLARFISKPTFPISSGIHVVHVSPHINQVDSDKTNVVLQGSMAAERSVQ